MVVVYDSDPMDIYTHHLVMAVRVVILFGTGRTNRYYSEKYCVLM